MNEVLNILCLEDSPRDAEIMRALLIDAGYNLNMDCTALETEFVSLLRKHKYDIILSDFKLPGFDGFEALRWSVEICPDIPFICVSGTVGEETAIELLKKGAIDYILKDRLVRLPSVISRALGEAKEMKARQQAEVELLQSYRFSDSLLKTIPYGMDIVDESGSILFQSDNFRKLFGENTIGKKCWEIYRDDKTQCSDCPLTHGIVIGKTEAYESYGVLGNRIFEISHTGMWYQSKTAMLEIFHDITDKKRSEEELIRAKDKAEESDRLKTAFLNNISHELRTPMNAIFGFSALLGEPDVDAQSYKEYIKVIMQSSNHLLSVISDIVEISNIEANLVRCIKTEINLNSTLQSLCSQMIPEANEKKIELVWETGLSDSDALILTDSNKLNQILLNLIGNALKFSMKGKIKLKYRVAENFLEFCVSDTGIGIPQEFHKKIFDRFYQVQHTESRSYDGIGLGLTISKAYVELLGGKIWLTSVPGKGTSIYFTIPYEECISETILYDEKSINEDFVFSQKKKILVAEDIESNFKMICYFLSGANAVVIRATNGKEAVEKCLSDHSIDLVLMDIKMPVMDGYTAVKLIRESMPDIPIIAQTAYTDDKTYATDCGCTGFISKPFDKKSLLRVIHEFI
jgi:PAS domain S-box-containing protein